MLWLARTISPLSNTLSRYLLKDYLSSEPFTKILHPSKDRSTNYLDRIFAVVNYSKAIGHFAVRSVSNGTWRGNYGAIRIGKPTMDGAGPGPSPAIGYSVGLGIFYCELPSVVSLDSTSNNAWVWNAG